MRAGWLAGTLTLTVLTVGCSSTSDLQIIRGQLAEIQRQLLLLNQESASSAAVENLGSSVQEQLAELVRAEADVGEELKRLGSDLETLQAKVDDALVNLNDMTRELAQTSTELESLQLAFGRALSAARSGGGGGPADTEPASSDDLYQASREHFLRGEYDQAIRGFRRYLEDYPITDLADNAQYWIAESYFNQGKFHQALAEFDRVESSFPSSERLASALLRKGYAYLELGDTGQGQQALQSVIDRFPRSDEAKLAQRQLDTLGG